MARSSAPHTRLKPPRPSPVHVRPILPGLSPTLRRLALQMAGGDPDRVKVLRPGAFEIIDPVTIP